MVRTQIQLTEKQAKALKELAAAQGVSVAELIRQSVDKFLRSSGYLTSTERRQRALAAIGRFHSGHTDISTRHDQYLTESFQP